MIFWKRTMALVLVLALWMVPAIGETNASAMMRLSSLGYLTNEMPDTMIAIRNFQTANTLDVTGQMDAATLEALDKEDVYTQTGYLEALAVRYKGDPIVNGTIGENVRALQNALNALGFYTGSTDGVFGDATSTAIKEFQTANGLYANGEADQAVLYRLYEGVPVAWEEFVMGKLCVKGDSGSSVNSLQRRLRRMGYFDGECTASFGDRTERAVIAFQKENGLTESGKLDDATCRIFYSEKAKVLIGSGILREGNSSEEVRTMQASLNHLGYYNNSINGEFRESTFIALTLYQIANGLEPNGVADTEQLATMEQPKAIAFADSADLFSTSAQSVTDETLKTVADTAQSMLGKAFAEENVELFPGFGFVQYVFAKAGIAIADPGQIVGGSGEQVHEGNSIGAGRIMALEHSDDLGVRMLFTLCLGDGRVAYVDSETGFVVSGDLDSMEYASAYVWKF